jgi:KDO2-lipid IV(A) lauroyltransferase
MSAKKTYAGWNVSGFNRGWIFRLSDLGCGLLPKRTAYALSDSLMDWYQGFRPKVADAIADNLRGAFPNWSKSEAERHAAGTFQQYGRGVVDYLRASRDPPRVIPAEGAAERLASVPGGKILVTAHMGNWEVGGYYIGRVIGHHIMVGFPEQDGGVEKFRQERRQSAGHTTLIARQGLSTLFRLRSALEKGESVVVLADRAVDNDRIGVAFRGRPAHFLKSPALLAQLTRAPILPVAVVCEGQGEYSAHVGEPIHSHDGSDAGGLMQRVADFFGTILERYPDQWYNFFPYWREDA